MEIKVNKGLVKALKKSGLEVKARQTVLKNASEMQRKSQSLSTVDTGFMKRSIGLNVGDGGMSVKVSPTAEYAPYVEYGTRFTGAQPFIRPAYNQQKGKFIKDMKSILK